MVRLHTSLLAFILVAGSALASSNEYQRRSNPGPLQLRFGFACANHDNLQSRGFLDEKDLSVRDLGASDDLEARSKFSAAADAVKFVIHHKNTARAVKAAGYAQDGANAYGMVQSLRSRSLEDAYGEDLFERDLDAFDDLEARSKFSAAADAVRFVAHHKNTHRAMKAAGYAQDGANAYGMVQSLRSRSLEDAYGEDLFERDLDAEDIVGRDLFD